MKLNELKNKSSKRKKRLGRGIGSSKGKTSGREMIYCEKYGYLIGFLNVKSVKKEIKFQLRLK